MNKNDFKSLRGMKDILPVDSEKWELLENALTQIVKSYNFKKITTPILEKTDLFVHNVGNDTDLVSKEMYTFNDRKNRSLTLRPEGTSPIIRAVLEHNLHHSEKNLKVFYSGPYFRYERPQKGRQRQFNQFGVEVISEINPYLDSEIIILAYQIASWLGIENFIVKINHLGNRAVRENFAKNLQNKITPYYNQLCADCQKRFSKNPLRILDCKECVSKYFFQHLPTINSYLTPEHNSYLAEVEKIMKTLQIPYEVDHNLVRGLDYYHDLVFEIICKSDLDSRQNTLIAGGRYSLEIAGECLSGVGFAIGLERLIAKVNWLKIGFSQEPIQVFIGCLSTQASIFGQTLLLGLRSMGIKCDSYYGQNFKIKKILKYLDSLDAQHSILIGDKELASQKITITNEKSGKKTILNSADVFVFFQKELGLNV